LFAAKSQVLRDGDHDHPGVHLRDPEIMPAPPSRSASHQRSRLGLFHLRPVAFDLPADLGRKTALAMTLRLPEVIEGVEFKEGIKQQEYAA